MLAPASSRSSLSDACFASEPGFSSSGAFGWTISSAVFDPVADLYVPHVRVVAYDHRGAGRSAPWLAPARKEVGVRVFDVIHDLLVGQKTPSTGDEPEARPMENPPPGVILKHDLPHED